MSDKDTLQLIGEHLVLALQPLKRGVSDLASFRSFMLRLGWHVQSLPPAYANLATLADDALVALNGLGDVPTPAAVLDVVGKVQKLYVAVQELVDAPVGVDAKTFLAEISERLFELLLVDYLAATLPLVYSAFEALGIIEIETHDATATRPPFVLSRLRFDQIPKVVSDPLSAPARVYGWGTPNLRFDVIARHVHELFTLLEIPASVERVDQTLGPAFQVPPDQTGKSIDVMVRVPIADLDIAGFPFEVALGLLEFPAEGANLPGVILQPLMPSSIGLEYDLTDVLKLRIRAGSDIASTFGIIVRPAEISVRYPFQPGTTPPSAGFGLELVYHPAVAKTLLGKSTASRLQVVGASAGIALDYHDRDLEFRLEMGVSDLALVLAFSDQDTFIASLFGGDDLMIPIPLGIRWSNKTGFNFVGSAGLEVSVSPHLTLGPISIDTLHLGLRATIDSGQPPKLTTSAGIDVSGALGPVEFSVEGMGVQLALVFHNGNAGPFNVTAGFKPPDGIGIDVDADVISGGGFLSLDREHGRYAGILYLDVPEVTVTAIGLLDTKLPGGRPGYSFLIIITADLPPIQLGLGFTLNGLGGLVGVHRTMVVDAIRAGIRNHSVDHILFPEDPIRDAPQIVSDLRTIFPVAEDRYVFGPMALIGWGEPTIVYAEIGILLELPSPVQLILLGKITALLPDEDSAVVELNLDILGVIDFVKKQLAIDATLHDSKIATFPIDGDMALRLAWGDRPSFVLAIGGFNPQFKDAPAGFPDLRRLTLAVASGDSRLTLQAYLALTSNTVQVGAKAELTAAAGGFSIYGWLGFDALFVLSPFAFVSDLGANVDVKRGGTVLATVHLDAHLTGTTPWHAWGRASVSLLFFDASVPFDLTVGEGRQVTLPAADPWTKLQEAIENPRNWSGELPAAAVQAVSLAAPKVDPVPVLVDPSGALTLRQKVVPLGRQITRFGSGAPMGHDRFEITAVTLGSTPVTDFVKASELFAPAQFEALSDAEKLSRPSFEPMDAGITVARGALAVGSATGSAVTYETIIIDSFARPWERRTAPDYEPSLEQQLSALPRAAAGLAPRRRKGFGRFAPDPQDPERVTLDDESFVVASTDDLSTDGDFATPCTKGAAYRALAEHLEAHPEDRRRLQVVPTHELAEVA